MNLKLESTIPLNILLKRQYHTFDTASLYLNNKLIIKLIIKEWFSYLNLFAILLIYPPLFIVELSFVDYNYVRSSLKNSKKDIIYKKFKNIFIFFENSFCSLK